MRRLLRILFTLSVALSLLLFAATVILWVRGYRIADQMGVLRILSNAVAVLPLLACLAACALCKGRL